MRPLHQAPSTRRADTPKPTAAGANAEDADTEETGPLRRCIVTRTRAPRESMIRFVVGPDRVLVPDLSARLPGRGIWLSARGDVLETARAKGVFARAARGQVTVPADLTTVLQAGLARRIGEFLGLARRAGQAVCGYQKAREWLLGGRAGLLVQARDGSAAERARLAGARVAGAEAVRVPVVAPLTAASLGTIFGRDHVVHVAIRPGRLADALRVEAARLTGLIGPLPDRIDGDGIDAVGIDGRDGGAQAALLQVSEQDGPLRDLPGGIA